LFLTAVRNNRATAVRNNRARAMVVVTMMRCLVASLTTMVKNVETMVVAVKTMATKVADGKVKPAFASQFGRTALNSQHWDNIVS
jgi:hypothetical protein